VWVTDTRALSTDDLKNFPGEDKKGSVQGPASDLDDFVK
jgi:hypothetical protein